MATVAEVVATSPSTRTSKVDAGRCCRRRDHRRVVFDRPVGCAVDTAVDRLLAAPRPSGASDATDPPLGVGDLRVEGTNVFRTELCSDGSCPMLTRYFTPLRPESLDAACDVLDDHVRSVGGRRVDECPPGYAVRSTSSSGQGSSEHREDVGVFESGSEWGNVVVFRLKYSVDGTGQWVDGSDVELVLGIGHQFCSDSAIAVPCLG